MNTCPDAIKHVVFSTGGKEMTDPQPISVKANTYDDVFVDYKFKAGTYDIEAKIINTNIPDDNSENNKVVRKSYFVDLDTDGDNIGNKKDIDDDNDGLSDEEEFKIGTDSKKRTQLKQIPTLTA